MTLDLVLILACLVMSAIFSGTETALTSLHEARLHKIIQRKPWGVSLLKAWHERPGLVLSSLLLGNNIVNILASSVATSISLSTLEGMGVDRAESLGIGLAVGVMTFVILVFGEVLPKTYSRHNPEAAIAFLPLMRLWYLLSFPLAKSLSMLTRGMVSLGGGQMDAKRPSVTEDEIEYLIQRSTEEGSLNAEKEQLLSGVFDLEETIAREIMVPRTDVVAFELDDTFEKVVKVMEENELSRYPVYKDTIDNIVGIFYAKDFITYTAKNRSLPFRLSNFIRQAYFVPKTKKLNELLREFQKEKVHMAVVLDEYGGTAGVVTLEDVIEEMVGEIYDEYDTQESAITRQSDGTYVAAGRLSIADLAEALDLEFPEERDFDTVAGLVMALTGTVPAKGQTVTWSFPADEGQRGIRFTVVDVGHHKIKKVQLQIL